MQSYAWVGKYVAAAGLVIVAIGWPEAEPLAAEVEPFKTAITSMFLGDRAVYVGYAAILLGIGLFTERAYCRFLCPLGGILATLDRLHIFNMLQAATGMRDELPSLRALMPGEGDQADRRNRHGGVLPVPRLPGRISR